MGCGCCLGALAGFLPPVPEGMRLRLLGEGPIASKCVNGAGATAAPTLGAVVKSAGPESLVDILRDCALPVTQ